MHDTNGDLKADKKDARHRHVRPPRLQRGAQRATRCSGRSTTGSTPRRSTSYLRWKNGTFDVQKTLSRGQWGASQDDAGRVFRNSNESALHVDLVPTLLLHAEPEPAAHARQRRVRSAGHDDDLNAVWPVHPTRGVNRGYQAGVLRDDGTLAHFTSACAPTVYRGDRLPAELYGNVFVAEPAANLVSRIVVSDDGTTLRREEGVRPRRVPRVHRRAVPSRLPVVGARRHASTSSTSIAASSSTAASSPNTCAIRSCRARSSSRSARGRIWRVVHDTTRADPIRRSRRRHRRRSWTRCRTRTAGGATPRSSCSCSATTRAR